jgi:hypothetical protein
MFITFFDVKGYVHKEFDPADQTINSAYYCEVLQRLPEKVRRLRANIWREKTQASAS